MNKKNIKYIFIAIIFGILIGRYIFGQYEVEAKKVMNEEKKYVYLMQYGVYSDLNVMNDNTKSLKNFFYYEDKDGYHVLIGITLNEQLKEKIINSYNIKENIYMKKVKIENAEFLQLLEQYDSLISQTDDDDIILTSEKQILSKYEELILSGY